MWSLESIRHLNEQAAQKARLEQRVPYVPLPEDTDPFPLPNLGPYVPPGWDRIEDVEWFVDSTGWGQPVEPALTIDEFRGQLRGYAKDHPDQGFGVIERGQFQCFVGAYRPTVSTEKAA